MRDYQIVSTIIIFRGRCPKTGRYLPARSHWADVDISIEPLPEDDSGEIFDLVGHHINCPRISQAVREYFHGRAVVNIYGYTSSEARPQELQELINIAEWYEKSGPEWNHLIIKETHPKNKWALRGILLLHGYEFGADGATMRKVLNVRV